LSLPPI